MDRARLADPELRIDGRRVAVACYLAYAGAYQLTLISVITDLALELHSSYLGHPDAAQTVAAHLELKPAAAPETSTELHFAGELAVADDRQRCLYDHLALLAELVRRHTAAEVTVDVADAAMFLIGNGGRAVTGEVLMVDAGYHAIGM